MLFTSQLPKYPLTILKFNLLISQLKISAKNNNLHFTGTINCYNYPVLCLGFTRIEDGHT